MTNPFRFFLSVWGLLLLVPAAWAQRTTTSDTPLSDRRVSYTMDVRLDPDARTVSGAQRMTWRNPDSVPVDELQFHLYLNAFRDNNSTFMKESGGAHRGFSAEGDNPWGGMDITSIRTADLDLTPRMRFIQPDDGNTDDRTVMSVQLPEAVPPGESIALDVEFTARMPEIVARTGWQTGESGRPFFMVAQWFPKFGVYEVPGQRYVPADAQRGAWSTHQFHANSEFYADFGTYDVTMQVPDGYVVGASGVRVSEATTDSVTTLRYLADDVHDFAWTASPDFLVYEDTWEHVAIRALIQPQHEAQAQRHLDAAKVALSYFDRLVGPYPYTTLTVVDGVGGSNGMEYPTLITAGTYYGMPEWFRPLELVIIHEFGHQYFYGLLASNEAEEAWLDEGMNSYLETRVMDAEWPDGSVIDIAGVRVMDKDFQRVSYVKDHPERGALFTKSWEYRFGAYGKSSYAKPATVMISLERYLGAERMQAFLHTYYERWAFDHPTTRDLQAVAEDVAGEDLDWFFDQFVYGEAVVDYRVESIRNSRSENADSSVTYTGRVRLERARDGTFPVVVRVTRRDGTTEDRRWNGTEPVVDMTFIGKSPVHEVFIDPDRVVWLDINFLNNRMVVPEAADNTFARRAQLRTLSFIQRLLFLAGGL